MSATRRRAGPAVLLAVCVTACAARLAAQPDAAQIDRLQDLSRAFRAVYEHVAPAVVLIRTSGVAQLHLPRFHPPIAPDEGEFTGLGSGVIVAADGYILSNYHVIQNADSIEVTLDDRRRLPAQVVGVDSLIDIALLKVDATGLPTATLGTSADLQIGDWVLAIGFPLGMGSTLTHGIVSALGRQAEVIRGDLRIESFIQTNAVINPGNSGGPLLDLYGNVVGINTAISTKTGYFIGYGLAVPVDLASEAMHDFLEHGRVVRGYLGIAMKEVDADLQRELHLQLTTPRGVYISRIFPGTPAARSQLLEGDVVVAVDGLPVNAPNQVQTRIYGKDPGESVTLGVLRDGAELAVDVILGERDEDRLLARGQRRVEQLGLTVAALDEASAQSLGFTDDVARQLGLQDNRHGVVVVDIDADSPAAARGLRVDDVITEIDRAAVASPEAFVRDLARLEAGQSALFWFWRRERGIDVRALPIRPQE